MGTSAKSEHQELHAGQLFLERYRIERRIADGGMASIYLAVDEHSGLPVAIKVLFSHYLDNSTVRARFLDEGRIQAMLQHPNIVHVYRVIQEPMLCFVMEYVEGHTLEEYLRRHGPLEESKIIELMLPVMSALGLAHTRGIVHRDLKPSNVLLKPMAGFFTPKVMDFGVAKVTKGRELTAAGTTVGTLHYMSPEQIVGARAIDGRADIYSLGCTLYKLATGEVPFNAASEFALMMAQVEAAPAPPRQLRPQISERLQKVILKALAKEPEQRFQSIQQMTSALIEVTSPDIGTSTDTRPIPRELLEMAMAANEVAQDQTAQFRLAPLLPTRPSTERSDAALATHEMSARAFEEISRDREIAIQRKSQSLPSLNARPDEDAGEHTRRALIDALPTDPETPAAEFDGEDQRATSSIPRKRIERALQDQATDEFNRHRSGIIAVDHGADSREVTALHLSASELRAAAEQARRAQRPPSPTPHRPEPPDAPATQEGVDTLERPRARRPSSLSPVLSGLADEDSAPTLGERPGARHRLPDQSDSPAPTPLFELAGEDSDPTVGERPGALHKALASNIAGAEVDSRDTTTRPAGELPQNPASFRARPLNHHQTQRHRSDTELPAAPSSRSGTLWVAGGLSAVFIALLVLIWALFLS
ncbi:hypothetical protein DL240_14110 [Lujinxingia litoralis]|uniref:non-specific serine/threonine protein kinase n=1 Tax=Lujinxingia litoralis TaxID=2211119 RepID=A0A328C5I1_9DELT|nr:serine/threonine-protein kinase [Lujinxingia litoralis]RAL21256.1 hypothetical protein DL240_14110 [Lujinxingia litoralis]